MAPGWQEAQQSHALEPDLILHNCPLPQDEAGSSVGELHQPW